MQSYPSNITHITYRLQCLQRTLSGPSPSPCPNKAQSPYKGPEISIPDSLTPESSGGVPSPKPKWDHYGIMGTKYVKFRTLLY